MLAHVQYNYRANGRIYASALIQGAGIPPLLSHQMVQYGQGYRESTIETVDRENAILIEKVQSGLITE